MASIYLDDSALDALLDALKNNAIRVIACAMGASANNYANVVANKLGEAVISATDFTHADRTGGGRKTGFGGKAITIDTTGTVDTIAFTDNVSVLYVVNLTSSSIAVTGGSTTLTVNAYDPVGVPDAVAA